MVNVSKRLRLIALRLPLLRRPYRAIADLKLELTASTKHLESVSSELTTTKSDLVLSAGKAESLACELAILQSELRASIDRGSGLESELRASVDRRSVLESELYASVDRGAALESELVASNKREDALSGELAASHELRLRVSHELSAIEAEVLASNNRETAVSRELAIAKAEALASNDRETTLSRELAIAKAEALAFNDRETALSRKLAIAKAEVLASNDRETALSHELATAKAEALASNDRETALSRALATARAEVLASNDRETALTHELAIAKAEVLASNDRETALSRTLATAKAEALASNDRETALTHELAIAKAELGMTAGLRDQLKAQTDHLLVQFADAQGHFTEAQNEFRRQMPLLTANVAALRSGQEDDFRSLRRRIVSNNQTGSNDTNAGTMTVDLYLDLLESSLTGTLYSDVAQSPWAKNIYDPASRAVGRDWPSQAETMIGTARMKNLRVLTQRALNEKVPGDLIETGVWRGGACIYMRGILAAAADTKRRVFVADSFRGLPPPDEAAYPADAGDPHHTFQQLAISRKEVEANFRRYGLLDDQVIFLEGWFKDTLPTAPIDRLAVLRLDGDMYESTMDALKALYERVSPGGFVIVDDYVLKACAAAVDDFRGHHGISAPMQEVDGAAVWWQVPAKPPIGPRLRRPGQRFATSHKKKLLVPKP